MRGHDSAHPQGKRTGANTEKAQTEEEETTQIEEGQPTEGSTPTLHKSAPTPTPAPPLKTPENRRVFGLPNRDGHKRPNGARGNQQRASNHAFWADIGEDLGGLGRTIAVGGLGGVGNYHLFGSLSVTCGVWSVI